MAKTGEAKPLRSPGQSTQGGQLQCGREQVGHAGAAPSHHLPSTLPTCPAPTTGGERGSGHLPRGGTSLTASWPGPWAISKVGPSSAHTLGWGGAESTQRMVREPTAHGRAHTAPATPICHSSRKPPGAPRQTVLPSPRAVLGRAQHSPLSTPRPEGAAASHPVPTSTHTAVRLRLSAASLSGADGSSRAPINPGPCPAQVACWLRAPRAEQASGWSCPHLGSRHPCLDTLLTQVAS